MSRKRDERADGQSHRRDWDRRIDSFFDGCIVVVCVVLSVACVVWAIVEIVKEANR